jgi:hypothetical protein
MSRNLLGATLMIAVLAATWLYATRAAAAEEQPSQFGDKLVLIYFKGRSAEFAFTLTDVTFTELNGRKMLSGTHADMGEATEWMRNRRAHLAWDGVESLTLYDSIEQYKEALESASDEAL